MRVEEEVSALIEKERQRYNREGLQPDLSGDAAGFGEEVTAEGFWDGLKAGIFDAFDDYARRQAEAGNDESYFVGEAREGLRVLDVMLRRYDVVVANPPYRAKSDVYKELANFLSDSYPNSKYDLYAAFIQRCIEFLKAGGRLGMIAQQSFMFISDYRQLRAEIMKECAIETVCHVGTRAFAEITGERVNTAMFVLRRSRENGKHLDTATGIYFRLTREPTAKAKRVGYERALGALYESREDSAIFLYRQSDLKAIPGAPWAYWVRDRIRNLFESHESMRDASPPKQGLITADNFRFLRYWWEVGNGRTATEYSDAWNAKESGRVWFPHMKGGSGRWWGDQEYVVNWRCDGDEIRSLGLETGRVASRAQNTGFYFHRGITFPKIVSGKFSARYSPPGFIFDVAGSSLFPKNTFTTLAVMNSTFADYALKLMNPTINVQVGDVARLPIPNSSSSTLEYLVEEALDLAKTDSAEDETTYDFVAPPDWTTGPKDVRERKERLAEVEAEIDEEVYRLYGISDEDRAAIEAELAEPTAVEDGANGSSGDTGEEDKDVLERQELARRWISYAAGVVLGRFSPGEQDALGRGWFPDEVNDALEELVDPDGVATLEADHPDDLDSKVERALELMVGEDATIQLLTAAGLASDTDGLRRYLEKDFFKWHARLYRKRPIYWLFQSPGRSYGFYVFHERTTEDTLFLLQGNRYLGGRINAVRNRISELSERISTAPQGSERKRFAKDLESLETHLTDLESFARNLLEVTSRKNSEGETVGWRPELDDGVLLNLAPLYTLMPAWSAEPRKAWDSLASGSYDWSHTAMRYWPDRVVGACRKNKSYAIAHGLLEEYAGGS